MATKYASATGVWSTMVWWTTSGGTTTTPAPTTGDDADMNGKTVSIDQNVTCSNIVGSGVVTVSGNRTITANFGNTSSAFTCTINGASQTVTIAGTVTGGTGTRLTISGASTTVNVTALQGGTTASAVACTINTAGAILSVSGGITGGSAANSWGLTISNGTVAVGGNLLGGGALAASAISQSGGSLTVTGTTTAGGGREGLAASGGTSTLNGAVLGDGAAGVSLTSGTHVCTINANVTAGSTASSAGHGISIGQGATANVNGTITGGSGTTNTISGSSFGALILANLAGTTKGTLNHVGNLVDGSTCSAIVNAGGIYNYTPTSVQTAIIGGKTLYPTAGAGGYSRGRLVNA